MSAYSLCILDFVPASERAAILAGTSTYDATASVQAAIDAAVSGGRSLYAPGHYRLTATINITGRLRFWGDGVEPNIGSINTETRGKGSWFFLDHSGVGFDINNDSVFRTGIMIEAIGTYRIQPDPAIVPFTPNAHDFDILVDRADVTLRDVMLLNPTQGVSVVNGGYGRLTCTNLRGQPLTTGIDVSMAADVCRFNDVHFWPFWSNGSGVRGYIQSSGAAFRFARCDNPIIDGGFSLGYNKFIEIRDDGGGTTSKLRATNCDADLGGWLLHVLSSGNNFTAQFSNCVAQGATTFMSGTNHNVQVEANNCRIQFDNCEFKDPNGCNVMVAGTGNLILVGTLTLSLWNRTNAGHTGIFIGTGNAFRASVKPLIVQAGVGSTAFIGGTGTIDCPLGMYVTSVTTDANGRANMTHNSGATPRKFIATVSGTTGRWVTLVSYQATNVTIEVRNASGVVASTPNIPVCWQVGY